MIQSLMPHMIGLLVVQGTKGLTDGSIGVTEVDQWHCSK